MDVILLTCLSGQLWQRSIGAYQLANYLRQHGVTVQVIDFTDLFATDELIAAVRHFITDSTKFVGVSSTFYKIDIPPADNMQAASQKVRSSIGILPDNITQTIKTIKQEYPNIKTILGGGSSSRFVGDPLFDVVVHGFAETAFLEHILESKRIWPKVDTCTIIDGDKETFDIEQLRHTWHERDCVLQEETLPIEISRGCIFRCKFCAYPLNGKKKFDYLRDPELIKEELINNYEQYGTTNYFFGDDTFNDSTQKVEHLHRVITALPFKIEFTTYLRLDLLHAHREQIPMLQEMGLGSAFFGIESMNERTAKFIGKGMKPNLIKEFLPELKNTLWKDEISILCTFITGLPFEDVASTDKTFEWINSQNISNVWAPLSINPTARYKSDIDINYAKYGYTMEKSNWSNNIMTYNDAQVTANRYNEYSIPNYGPRSWVLFALLSARVYNRKTLESIAMKDLPSHNLIKVKEQLITEYKQKLLGC